MSIERKIKESPLRQGADEQVAYTLTTTPWGSSPSSPSVVMKLGDTDVSSDVLSGSASASGDCITTPVVQSLKAGLRYRMEIKFTINSYIFEAYAYIDAET